MKSPWLLRAGLIGIWLLLYRLPAPWWVLILPAFVSGFFFTRAARAFWQVFALAFSLLVAVVFIQDLRSGLRIAPRIGGVLGLPFSGLAYWISALIAALPAGLAAWCGQTLRPVVFNSPRISSALLCAFSKVPRKPGLAADRPPG